MPNWTDLVIVHGNEEGARRGFEKACVDILTALHPSEAVRAVRPHQGDGGIDVYIGQLGVAPVDVYQCKYFLRGVGKSQRDQIRRSFETTAGLTGITVKSWNLCLPLDLSIEESLWFDGWAAIKSPKPALVTPATLMKWARETGLEPVVFERRDSLKLDWIVERLGATATDPWPALFTQAENDSAQILLGLVRMHFNALPEKPAHLAKLHDAALGGDRFAASQYVKGLLAGSYAKKHKIWLFTLLHDFSMEPVAYKFIRRYDVLVEKAKALDHLHELSTSEYYSVWTSLTSPVFSDLRSLAGWTVRFTTP